MSVWGIVVTAGQGRRFGAAKHQAALGGRALWRWAEDALRAGGADDVVVVGPVPGGVPGGPRRRDSVAAGLAEVPPEADLTLVHDAARPLASPQLVARVIERLRVGDVQAVVPGIPVRDALKQVAGEWVAETLDRTQVVAVQTPQGFSTDLLRKAHAAHAGDAPDDAALVERTGEKVAVIVGERTNLKVTYPEDLALAEALLALIAGEGGPS